MTDIKMIELELDPETLPERMESIIRKLKKALLDNEGIEMDAKETQILALEFFYLLNAVAKQNPQDSISDPHDCHSCGKCGEEDAQHPKVVVPGTDTFQ